MFVGKFLISYETCLEIYFSIVYCLGKETDNNNSRIYIVQNLYKSSNALETKKGESRDRHGSTSKKCPPGYD